MSPEKSQALCKQFPSLFSKPVTFYCGEGWCGLLQKLCFDIAAHATAAGIRPTVVSVQEKYGSLRVEISPEDAHIQRLLQAAEDASEKTCDVCGEPGALLDDGVWVKTRCPAHS